MYNARITLIEVVLKLIAMKDLKRIKSRYYVVGQPILKILLICFVISLKRVKASHFIFSFFEKKAHCRQGCLFDDLFSDQRPDSERNEYSTKTARKRTNAARIQLPRERTGFFVNKH